VRLPKFRYAVLTGATLGGLVPVLFFISAHFQEFVASGKGIFLWPSGLLLIGATERDSTFWLAVIISALPNVILYAVVAALVWSIVCIIQRVVTRTP
jgi:hypothetical protein